MIHKENKMIKDMKSRIQSTIMACLALLCAGFASCTDDALVEASQKYAGKFELTVTQANPDSPMTERRREHGTAYCKA